MLKSTSIIQTKTSKGKSKQQKIVYKISNNTNMKFRPERTMFGASSGFIDRIKSLSKIFSRQSTESHLSPPIRKSNQFETTKKNPAQKQLLNFLFKLDCQTFLIGNKKQLDAISLSSVEEYIQTEQLWSLSLKSPFLHITIEEKRKLIIAAIKGQIIIYTFEGKKSKKSPQLIKSLRIFEEVKKIQIIKDKLIVFFQLSVSSFVLDGANSRQVFSKQLKINKSLALYQLGQCIQNTISVFYELKKAEQEYFQLWCLNIQIIQQKLVVGKMTKVYDVQNIYKGSLKIQSITKDAFLMNLGPSILLFSKGYYVDKFFINLKIEGTFLKYFNQYLIHISHTQIDFYYVTIDLLSNPPKLLIKSFDSIINIDTQKYQFFDAIRFQQHKMAFFYYYPFTNNSGEIKYIFNLTQKWDYQQKIDHILPKISSYKGTYQGKQFKQLLNKIQISCDSVRKMGMSRKQAYLRIWRQSKKQHLQQFKLLLDTLDYHTIREQIMQKLRKKSMGFLEVIKMQSGCFGMIHQNIFGKHFSIDQFKNYATSHFLVRKLELFKEIKLYQKQMGKVKLHDSQIKEDRLLINIQEYTNVIKMDIKNYLLDLIFNYAKFKKDLTMEIRMVIRKFKFTFLYLYEGLLKEIVNIVKQDLLFLLKNIPQLLPYTYQFDGQHQEASLRSGLWKEFKQQEWDNALFLDNIVSVYNKQAIIDFGNSLWIKRNWLTLHNLIFLNKNGLIQVFNRSKAEGIFYSLVEYTFDNYNDPILIKELTNFLQETYTIFPHHLFNCVQLYRQLYLYFKQNQLMNEPFQVFLRKNDQEIFKKIFQHQKFKKGSFLKQVKPIYQNQKHSDKFNISLLKYFSSNLSEVSDIKYLLNRINNEKEQFHSQNEEMYQVLVKGMQIKLKLGSENDIPMQQVLIYIEKIPLSNKKNLQQQITILQNISLQASKFKRMKLNMSVFQMIRNRDNVLFKVIGFQIQQSKLRNSSQQDQILAKSQQIINKIAQLRKKIYGFFEDNVIIFLFIIKLMQTQNLIKFVPKIISQNIDSHYLLSETVLLQNAVFFCYRQQMINQPLYQKSSSKIKSLCSLLTQDNNLRVFISSQFQLASIFSTKQNSIRFPICGQNGFFTISQLQYFLNNLEKRYLLQIKVAKVYQLTKNMQQIQGIEGQSLLNLTDLHEIYFAAMLKKKALKEAISVIYQIISLQPNNPFNIVYPLVIFKWIGQQFTEENKWVMIALITNLFLQPLSLVKVFQGLLFKSFTNQEQKNFLIQNNSLKQESRDTFTAKNILFAEEIIQFLQQNPEKSVNILQLLNDQFTHLLHTQQQFSKSIDIVVYHILLTQQPILLAKYIHLNKNLINLKEFKSFISYVCKYQLYDHVKLLQLCKRIFKVLYDIQNREGEFRRLIQQVLNTPLTENRSIDGLVATTPNLEKLAKCIQRFKSKIKFKTNARSLSKKRNSQSGIYQKYQKINSYLADPTKYLNQTEDYPFPDSDGCITRQQYLIAQPFVPKINVAFNFKKYLHWLLSRTNQSIQYYLIKSNQDEEQGVLLKQQQALKLSFRKTANDKGAKEHANLFIKTFNHMTKAKTQRSILEQEQIMFPISTIPVIPSSAISIGQLWSQQIEEVYLGSALLKDQIIKSITYQQQKITFDHTLLQSFGTSLQLQQVIPDLLKEIYIDQKLEYSTATALISQIYNLYPRLTPINMGFLQVYSKIEQLQKKLGLNLSTRQVLSYQGLLLKQKDINVLFKFIKESLLSFLNQNNIHTLSRVISFSFKKNEFQQQIINQYFKIIVKQYNQLENQFDQNMKLQKITAFAQKMPLTHLKLEAQKIIESMDNKDKKSKIIGAISNIMRSRNDVKSAQLLNKKGLA